MDNEKNATPSNTSVANETVALARKLAASWGSWNEYEIQALAAALREAKAQAWEAMARRYDDLYEVADPACHIKMDDSRARELSIYRSEAKYCRHRAAALRSKQNAPAKKAKTAGTDHEFEWGGKWLGICGRCGGDHKPAAQPSAEPSRKED